MISVIYFEPHPRPLWPSVDQRYIGKDLANTVLKIIFVDNGDIHIVTKNLDSNP